MSTNVCFVCDGASTYGQQNFNTIKSQYSGYPILIFMRKFVRKSILRRNINDANNCICSECLACLNEYDELCVKAKRIEDKLHKLLLASDKRWVQMGQPNGEIETDIQSYDSANEINSKEEFTSNPVHSTSQEIPAQSRVSTNFTSQKSWECSNCGQKFLFQTHYLEHMKWHNKTENQPNIRCQLCLTEFSDEADFKAHTELHANLSPLQCIECKRTFLQKNNLVKHMQFHYKKKDSLICEVCGKTLSSEWSYRSHMKVHNNIRNEKCHICSREFRDKTHLNKHLITHTGEKPFSCRICKKAFNNNYNRNVHEKLHGENGTEAINVHRCQFCPSSFARKTKLHQHMEKNHATMIPHNTIENQLDSTEIKARSLGHSI